MFLRQALFVFKTMHSIINGFQSPSPKYKFAPEEKSMKA